MKNLSLRFACYRLTLSSCNQQIVMCQYLVLLAILLPLMTGCAVSNQSTRQLSEITQATDAVDLSQNQAVSTILLNQYLEWQDTPYKMGGLSKNGVDCSGFVYITFRSKLGYDIPRTTESLVKVGSTVNRRSLRPGDLLFFKTGFFSRHVGIYFNDSKFIHASTSRGVIVSSLKEQYWQKNYWTAKRLTIQ